MKMMLKDLRALQAETAKNEQKNRLVYLPSFYKDKKTKTEIPAILVTQETDQGNLAYAFYQNGKINENLFCSSKLYELAYLDENKIQEVWEENDMGKELLNIGSKKVNENFFVFGLDNINKYKDFLKNSKNLNFACEKKDRGEICEHIKELLANVNNVDNGLLNELLPKNFKENKADIDIEANYIPIESPSVQKNAYKPIKTQKINKKNIKINFNNPVEKAMGLGMLYNKITMLLGPTGMGKTTTVKQVCQRENIDLFMTTVGMDGNHKKALFGEKDIEPDGKGNIGIIRHPGALVQAARNYRDKGKASALFIDEALRSNGLDALTLLTPHENTETGEMEYEIDGIERQRFAYIKNIQTKQEGWILLTSDSSHLFDNENLTNPLPKNINKDELKKMAVEGKVPRVNNKDLELSAYKIESYGDIFQEKFKIPISSLMVVMGGNYGTKYTMSMESRGGIDDAVLSRSYLQRVDLMDISPADAISFVKNKGVVEDKDLCSVREILPEEKKKLEYLYGKFLNGIVAGIKQVGNDGESVSVSLPAKAYNLRNINDITSIEYVPQNVKNMEEYLKFLIEDVFLYNYVENTMGEETILPNYEQKEFIEILLEKVCGKEEIKEKITEEAEEEKKTISRKAKMKM